LNDDDDDDDDNDGDNDDGDNDDYDDGIDDTLYQGDVVIVLNLINYFVINFHSKCSLAVVEHVSFSI